MSRRSNDFLLEDMLDAANKIVKYTNGMSWEEFQSDEKTIDAVIRNFEIIGEAANRLETQFKIKNSQLKWDELRGFRNRLVHEYFGIDLGIVWAIIQVNLENYIQILEKMLNKGAV